MVVDWDTSDLPPEAVGSPIRRPPPLFLCHLIYEDLGFGAFVVRYSDRVARAFIEALN